MIERANRSRERWRRVCVFCGSSDADGRFQEATVGLGRLLATSGLTLVYGGGRGGLMGTLADAVLGAGGRVIGVAPRPLVSQGLAHPGITELRVTPTLHARKALMAELADAFVALPGGFGTFEETLEMLTWSQLGIHDKPVGVLNLAGYYEPLLRLVDQAVALGFVSPEHRRLLTVADDPVTLIERMGYPAVVAGPGSA
jgi:uncharacterized protein (TIGR00730 family)